MIRSGTGSSYSSTHNNTAPISKPMPKPAPAPAQGGMSIVDALRNGRPALRSVSQQKQKEAEEKERGEGTATNEFSNVFNKTLRPSDSQSKNEADEASFEPVPLTINGKKLQTQQLPGQDSMSFSDMIKVASKVSLRRAEVERSPGGTPINKRVVRHDSVFSARLQEKFKSLRPRDSFNGLGALDENDKENWE